MIRYNMQGDDDCLRACIETVLQCPGDVPNLVGESDTGWYESLREWAHQRGLEAELHRADRHIPPGHYICVGQSPRHEEEVGHAVVMVDRRMVHDPHTSRSGIRTKETVISFTVCDIEQLDHWRTNL